jgi:hypothetical protein
MPPESSGQDTPEKQTEVAKFWANRGGEAIIVKLVNYGNKRFIEIRKHFTNREGKFSPTHHGVTLSIRKLPDLLKALTKAARHIAAADDDG